MNSLLYHACLNGDLKVVTDMINNHADEVDVSYVDSQNGLSTLHVSLDHCDIVSVLLTHPKVDVNVKDIWGDSALIRCCAFGLTESAKLLLSKSEICLNYQSTAGNTAFRTAIYNNNVDIVKLLLDCSRTGGKKLGIFPCVIENQQIQDLVNDFLSHRYY
jgi:ankyrin repeat protein